MKKKLCLSISLVFSLPIILTGCVNSAFNQNIRYTDPLIPEKIEIDGPEKINYGCGAVQYSILVEPSDASKDVVWESSDTDVLSIDDKGLAYPLRLGSATITATSKYDKKIIDTLEVTILDVPNPTAISIDGPSEIFLHKQPTYQYSILTTPEVAKSEVNWSVIEGDDLAYIDKNGGLKPKKAGQIKIRAESIFVSTVFCDFPVLIKPEGPNTIKIKGTDGIHTNSKAQFSITTEPEERYDEVEWSVNDASLGSISETGELQTFGRSGYLTVTAKSLFDESIRDNKIVHVSDDIIFVNVADTIGHGFDLIGKNYVEKNQPYQLKFLSTLYKNDSDKSSDWIVIHKELKPTDLEVMRDGDDIMDECSIQHNVLSIPAEFTDDEDITIHILGAELNDTLSWSDISKITAPDYEDLGRASKQNASKYFQVGDYKKGYVEGKYQGEFVIVDQYHDSYEVKEHSTTVTVPISLTFMQRVLHVEKDVADDMPYSHWEDPEEWTWNRFKNDTAVVYNTTVEDEEEEGEIIVKCYVRKALLDAKLLDGLDDSIIKIPRKKLIPISFDYPAFEQEDKYWIPAFAEVYDEDVSYIFEDATWLACEEVDPAYGHGLLYKRSREGSLYAYFDKDKYAFYNDGRPRIPWPEEEYDDDNYTDIPVILRTTFTTFPSRPGWDGRHIYDQQPWDRGYVKFIYCETDGDAEHIDEDTRRRYSNTCWPNSRDERYRYSICFCI